MRDNLIGTLVNQGITFLILFIIFKMTAFATSSKEVNDKIDSKVSKVDYVRDWQEHDTRNATELNKIIKQNDDTYKMVLFLYQNEIKNNK